MKIVSMPKAKKSLAKLIEQVACGHEPEIIIAKHGKPAARIVRLPERVPEGMRLGVARGKFVVPDSIDDSSAAQAVLMAGCAP